MTTEDKAGFAGVWTRLSVASRWLFGGVLLLIVVGIATATVWTLRADYQVLFSRLNEGDAAAIVDELKQLKMPYRLAEGGSTILVPADQVYETRLSLTSSGTPLAGGRGLRVVRQSGNRGHGAIAADFLPAGAAGGTRKDDRGA